MTIHEALTTAIRASGKTQTDVATAAGMQPQQICDLLAGRRLNVRAETIRRIASACECEIVADGDGWRVYCKHELVREQDGSISCTRCGRVGDLVDGMIVWR